MTTNDIVIRGPWTVTRFFAILVIGTLFTVHGARVFAADPGTTTGELLKIPVGTRAIGMGEAYTALADDASAIYWNPAGMSFVSQKEASFMHSSLIENVHLEQLSFVAPGDSYAFGSSFNYLGYGNIAGYDNAGNATGNVSAYSYVLNGGLARLINDSLSLGLSGGLLHETLDTDSANTFSVNAGALYQLPFHPLSATYNLGASLLNLGPGLKYVSQRDPLPRQLKFGIAAMGIKQLPLNLTADVGVPNDNSPYLAFGSEYWFRELIALRLGYAGANTTGKGLRVGLGIKYANLLFDYAYGGYGDFGASQQINLSMRFGEKVHQLNNDERAILKEAKASQKEGAYVPAILAYNELLEKDPSNDHILHMMIAAHDQLAKSVAQQDVSQKAVAIPSPEDAAMAEMVPDAAPAVAQSPAAPTLTPDAEAMDPMGYNQLPDVNTLDVAVSNPFKGGVGAPMPANVPTQASPVPPDTTFTTPSNLTTNSDVPPASPAPAVDNNAPALSPSDIYGN